MDGVLALLGRLFVVTKCSIKEADFDLLTPSVPALQRAAVEAGKANEDGPYWAWKYANGVKNPNYWGGETFKCAPGFRVVV